MADPKQPQDVLNQITEAWAQARAQLAQLRASVERANQLAATKMESNILVRDRDRALRDLGEAVWAQVKAGRLALPAAVATASKAIQEVERKTVLHNQEINSLIQEGGEAIDRIKARTNKSPRSAVAAKARKR